MATATLTLADFDAPALQHALAGAWPGLRVEVLESVDSTNTRLIERAAAGDATPCLLAAVEQTAGRGRMGRRWQAQPGASLTFSLAVPLAPPSWSGLSLAVGVTLAEALDPRAPGRAARVGLKWPNDLWRLDAPGRGRKLGGVLVETVAASGERVAVVGIGLNLRALDAPPDTGYASLDEFAPELADAPAALRCVALPLAQALRRFGEQGFAPFAAAFRARDVLIGQPVTTLAPGAAAVDAVADGIDDDGALRLRRGAVVHSVVSGEVSVRPRAA